MRTVCAALRVIGGSQTLSPGGGGGLGGGGLSDTEWLPTAKWIRLVEVVNAKI